MMLAFMGFSPSLAVGFMDGLSDETPVPLQPAIRNAVQVPSNSASLADRFLVPRIGSVPFHQNLRRAEIRFRDILRTASADMTEQSYRENPAASRF
jgi:hypothetical protein